jgi:hypothetical protein
MGAGETEAKMSKQVVLELPEETYQRASHLAKLTQRRLADILTDAVDLALPSLPAWQDSAYDLARPLTTLSDSEVVALTKLEMDADDDQQLTLLLDRQQAGLLSEVNRIALGRLMQAYQEGLLYKAQALAEAVQRGLRPALTP